jgi:hypothetical protein
MGDFLMDLELHTLRRPSSEGSPEFVLSAYPELRKLLLSSSVADQGTEGTAMASVTSSPSAPIALVYMHGIGRHPAPEDVKRGYDEALFQSDLGDNTKLAYWADVLHPGIPEFNLGIMNSAAGEMLRPELIRAVPNQDSLPADLSGWIERRSADSQSLTIRWNQLIDQYQEHLGRTSAAEAGEQSSLGSVSASGLGEDLSRGMTRAFFLVGLP